MKRRGRHERNAGESGKGVLDSCVVSGGAPNQGPPGSCDQLHARPRDPRLPVIDASLHPESSVVPSQEREGSVRAVLHRADGSSSRLSIIYNMVYSNCAAALTYKLLAEAGDQHGIFFLVLHPSMPLGYDSSGEGIIEPLRS